jgi:hypothetical protein
VLASNANATHESDARRSERISAVLRQPVADYVRQSLQ